MPLLATRSAGMTVLAIYQIVVGVTGRASAITRRAPGGDGGTDAARWRPDLALALIGPINRNELRRVLTHRNAVTYVNPV